MRGKILIRRYNRQMLRALCQQRLIAGIKVIALWFCIDTAYEAVQSEDYLFPKLRRNGLPHSSLLDRLILNVAIDKNNTVVQLFC